MTKINNLLWLFRNKSSKILIKTSLNSITKNNVYVFRWMSFWKKLLISLPRTISTDTLSQSSFNMIIIIYFYIPYFIIITINIVINVIQFFIWKYRILFQVISYDSVRGGVSVVTEKGDVTVSYLLIQDAVQTDSGKYSCNPSNADVSSVVVHVLNGKSKKLKTRRLAQPQRRQRLRDYTYKYCVRTRDEKIIISLKNSEHRRENADWKYVLGVKNCIKIIKWFPLWI